MLLTEQYSTLIEKRTNGRHFVFLKTGPVFKWYTKYTKDIAHRQTILIPNHLKSELQKVWYSNGARGSSTDLCHWGPAKVKARKSILFP